MPAPVPKCLLESGHFGTGAEVSWYRSVLGPKCPVTLLIMETRYIFYGAVMDLFTVPTPYRFLFVFRCLESC